MNLDELEEKLSRLENWPPVQLTTTVGYVNNAEKFVRQHLKTLRNNPGRRRYLIYFKRLKEYYEKASAKEV